MEDKNIIKITLLIVILSLLFLFSYLNSYNGSNKIYVRCSNGSFEEYNASSMFECGELRKKRPLDPYQTIGNNIQKELENVAKDN